MYNVYNKQVGLWQWHDTCNITFYFYIYLSSFQIMNHIMQRSHNQSSSLSFSNKWQTDSIIQEDWLHERCIIQSAVRC